MCRVCGGFFAVMNDQRTPRVAIVADDIGPAHGVPWTLTRLREQALAGYTIDIARSERSIDTWTLRRPDLVHLGARSRATDAARAAARALGIRTVVSHHLASGPQALGDPGVYLSPGPAADALLFGRGVAPQRIARWEPGACAETLHPARYAPDALPHGFTLLYAGPLAAEHGLDLLADAVRIARERDPRLHLAVAGDGASIERALRHRLGGAVTLLGPLTPDRLAEVYATADLYVSPGTADLFGQSILEAQASGLPVVAVDGGAATELIDSGRDGCLVPPIPEALAAAIVGLARRSTLCDRLVTGGLVAARRRTWERSRTQLAAAYALALAPAEPLAAPGPLPAPGPMAPGPKSEVARAA